ncbi:MAG: hypothetical protein O2816_08150 [Planctomycetota bacterium]|nr:hypothetical protein [Planctomycetota bacterium]
MILASLLLTVCGQDLELEAKTLRGEGRYLQALEVAANLPEDRARLHRLLILWTGGDLGGALREALARPDDGRIDATQRELCSCGTRLALQLGEVDLACEFVDAWEQQVFEATDLSSAERQSWIDGWAPGTGVAAAREEARALAQRLDGAERGTDLARGTTLGLGALVLISLGWLSRR